MAVAIALLVAAGVVVVVVRPGGSSSTPLALPRSMASAGDSITRAFDVDPAHLLQDAPAESWSTGTDPAVRSQYERIAAAAPAIAGHVFNVAQSGAKMDALASQLRAAGADKVDYLTVLMGANDLCTPTVATMTPAATFQAQFTAGLDAFFAADPTAHVFVSSIPDLFKLWTALQSNPVAQTVWALAHICQSMLSVSGTPAGRAAVAAQELTDNGILESVCARYKNCRFDGLAVYRASFGAGEISAIDYFHPSLTGQQRLAAITWAAGYWPTTP
ncbi:MAG TPA: GDSL-type esterase/lipase family protein [Acidimicrobiales bacterium]|nr:GDSL-type esterase/lipase family protein [Acidimicrobiales bacterium]